MREIEFRGISIDDHPGSIERKGKFIYGDYIDNEDGTYGIRDREEEWHYSVNPETVGQYTGLKDKNGKEIYEGDIFNLGDKKILHIVEWYDNGFMGKQKGTLGSYVGLAYWNSAIEVVGNIHVNPELLKEGKEC